ncbi:hypothetical protein PFICI_14701 [Pestalotiopsis fici W106-1]|uniref:Uncharacterized protein n=1 Tax=Pestalotiopsis fici (strain W106-1 / CGMCC3.15140) TaxID=1229662 RepID=W3WIM0_PESFW|nr:uncharacterized protein PFICI_14701 [Pestalotiopsis fici W106-1]ETS73755.1 hypothetical protein PFICI_14701 [Pestalotiopsis fici W106-1]
MASPSFRPRYPAREVVIARESAGESPMRSPKRRLPKRRLPKRRLPKRKRVSTQDHDPRWDDDARRDRDHQRDHDKLRKPWHRFKAKFLSSIQWGFERFGMSRSLKGIVIVPSLAENMSGSTIFEVESSRDAKL